MARGKPQTYNLDLFTDEAELAASASLSDWPSPQRFPLNVDQQQVQGQVIADLRGSQRPLIITGYAALDRLIDFIADINAASEVRILLGFEPFPARRDRFEVKGHAFPEEIQHYWLERGISLRLSAKLIHCIERLQSGRVVARYAAGSASRLHAKIYVGDGAATVGSSNFTRPGMEHQLEANARFTRDKEPKRYTELHTIAENYWELGRDYNTELIALLEQLLQVVPWQEALARACAELLEGDWAKAYLRANYLPGETDMWPSQRQGIAQALYILSRQGSVLVADATGSGKTRMGTHLIRAIQDHIIRSGRLRQGKALMVCPPAVERNWGMEAHLAGTAVDIYSHGSLSHRSSGKHDMTVEALRRAQILCVDEGHNFLNFKSNRTQQLLRNMSDHVLLFTATPINRSVLDLLRIADMLGADNLDESTLKAFRKMLGVKSINRSLTEEEIAELRKEIQRFTVRRTKRMLNQLIDREPDQYRDQFGETCRFPQHKPEIYTLDEPEGDRALALQIRELADQLYAVTHFVKAIEMPDILTRQGWTEETYLNSRLASAKKIARYIIMSSLRSSRAALAEHIIGTRKAAEEFGLKDFRKQNESGDTLNKLERRRGKVPLNKLSIDLPDWLTDEHAHAAACDHDRNIYEQIHQLLMRISAARESGKAAKLCELAERHDLLLAFDTRPITLAVIQQSIKRLKNPINTLIATGDAGSSRAEVLETFKPGSDIKGVIGLCSDSLAEGVNLQQASALLHLDMPSVVRIAEQRVGRIDRMDSPHTAVEAWWPEDAPEFALSSDDRFVERYETVDSLLGSNMPLPENLQTPHAKAVTAKEMIAEYEREAAKVQWDGIYDAFEPVRRLIQGKQSLVEESIYEQYRHISARVLSRVSLVRAESPWAFICIAAGPFGAPRWIFLPSFMGQPITDLQDVAQALRDRLVDEIEDLAMDDLAADYLNRFLGRISDVEQLLLPRKKQRALEEMQIIMDKFLKEAAKLQDEERFHQYEAIIDMLQTSNPEYQPDWDEVSARWLDLIRPVWYEKLQQPRNKPLLLKDIRKELINKGFEFGDLVIQEFKSFPVLPSADERVSACIIGVV
ncbi:MAG: SNF2-related protein [Pseudomonadota bacterium]